MQVITRYEWLDVCAEAAISEDPQRFDELVEEINAILRREQQRLHATSEAIKTPSEAYTPESTTQLGIVEKQR